MARRSFRRTGALAAGSLALGLMCAPAAQAAHQFTSRAAGLSGDPAPGAAAGADVNLSTMGDAAFNAGGQTAFRSNLSGADVDATNNVGIFAEDETNQLNPVARTGDAVPDADAGTDVNFTGLGNPAFDAGNRTAFRADLGGADVDAATNTGIFAQNDAGEVQTVARAGAAVPDADAGANVNFADFNDPLLADGRAAFRASLAGDDVTGVNDTGIFAQNDAGEVQTVARAGADVPDAAAG